MNIKSSDNLDQDISCQLLMSTKADGNMQLNAKEVAIRNREAFLSKIAINPNWVVSAQLVNGNTVKVVSKADSGKIIMSTDGLVTSDLNIFLSITVADCLPIAIYKEKQVVSLLHGGWRGLNGGIIQNAINKIKGEYGIFPDELSAKIGAGIDGKHYEIGQEVVDQFLHYPNALILINNKYYLDIKLVAREQLLHAGIVESNIFESDTCTYCSPLLFSARRDKLTPVHVMMILTSL